MVLDPNVPLFVQAHNIPALTILGLSAQIRKRVLHQHENKYRKCIGCCPACPSHWCALLSPVCLHVYPPVSVVLEQGLQDAACMRSECTCARVTRGRAVRARSIQTDSSFVHACVRLPLWRTCVPHSPQRVYPNVALLRPSTLPNGRREAQP